MRNVLLAELPVWGVVVPAEVGVVRAPDWLPEKREGVAVGWSCAIEWIITLS
jgi:hypothetical protein